MSIQPTQHLKSVILTTNHNDAGLMAADSYAKFASMIGNVFPSVIEMKYENIPIPELLVTPVPEQRLREWQVEARTAFGDFLASSPHSKM